MEHGEDEWAGAAAIGVVARFRGDDDGWMGRAAGGSSSERRLLIGFGVVIR